MNKPTDVEMPHPPQPAKTPNHHNHRGDVLVLANSREVQMATLSDRTWARSTDIVNVCLFGLAVLIIASTDAFFRSLGVSDTSLHEFIQEVNLTSSLWLFLFLFLYEMVGTGVSVRTLGKKKIRIRVVTHSDGETPPPPKRVLLRSLIPNTAGAAGTIIAATIADLRHPGLAGLALWILIYLSATLNKDRRGWHDKIAGTVVIEDPKPQPNKPSLSTLPETTEQKPTQSWGMVSDYYTKKPPPSNEPDNSNPIS